MQIPFFSVIIPTYNREKLLKEAILSVLNQTFSDFELIVVDDYSVNNTKSMVESFEDNRIRYYINTHSKGGAGARNEGIFRAKGDWVAFLDDDDIWLPEKLKLFYDKIKEVDSTVGLIYSGRAEYDFQKKLELSVFTPEKEGWIQKDLLYSNYIGTFSGVVIRTDLLKEVGGLDERFWALQDTELYVRISVLSRVAFIKDKLTYMRSSNKDRISINYKKKLSMNLLFWKKYMHLINRDPKIRHRAASRVFIFAVITFDIKNILRAMPWALKGIIYDTSNFTWTFKEIFFLLRDNLYFYKNS